MVHGIDETREAQVGEYSLSAVLASVVALGTYPLAAVLIRIWKRPGFYFGLAVTLSVTVLGTKAGLLPSFVPPIVPVCALFLLLAVSRGGVHRIVSTWQASPTAFWLFVLVCVVEALVGLYYGSATKWAYPAGRWAFFVVLLTTVALCEDTGAVGSVLRGVTCGAAFISLLAVLRVVQVAPDAAGVALGRTFGPVLMPFRRTLGVAMSPDKYGIMASVAVATLVVGASMQNGEGWPRPVRALLLIVTLAGAVISQGRGVYMTVLLAMGLSVLAVRGAELARRLSGARIAWFVAIAYATGLLLANLLFPYLAPQALVNVGSERSVRNVYSRIEANALGLQLLRQQPVLGIGHDTIEQLTFTTTGIHNHFFEQFVATGLVGGIPYLLFHLLVLAGAVRLMGQAPLHLGAAARTLVISVLSIYLAYQFFPGFFVSIFALISGLVLWLKSRAHVYAATAPLEGT